MNVTRLVCIVVAVLSFASIPTHCSADDTDRFAEIFIHPRDRHYLPDQAPSRPQLLEERVLVDDARGPVRRYEYQGDGAIISRELWTNQRGETEGRFGIGIPLN